MPARERRLPVEPARYGPATGAQRLTFAAQDAVGEPSGKVEVAASVLHQRPVAGSRSAPAGGGVRGEERVERPRDDNSEAHASGPVQQITSGQRHVMPPLVGSGPDILVDVRPVILGMMVADQSDGKAQPFGALVVARC